MKCFQTKAWCLQHHFRQNFEFKKCFVNIFKVQAGFQRMCSTSEINASKVKLCKFQNQQHVKFSPPVDMTQIVAQKIELHFTATKKIKNAFFLLFL